MDKWFLLLGIVLIIIGAWILIPITAFLINYVICMIGLAIIGFGISAILTGVFSD